MVIEKKTVIIKSEKEIRKYRDILGNYPPPSWDEGMFTLCGKTIEIVKDYDDMFYVYTDRKSIPYFFDDWMFDNGIMDLE